ncbi:hypothetical protein JL720_6662 [Aureococcus anophagefferens]|nr:hypothetical protein JL720_6662 [Aureococcus anophagefferens]
MAAPASDAGPSPCCKEETQADAAPPCCKSKTPADAAPPDGAPAGGCGAPACCKEEPAPKPRAARARRARGRRTIPPEIAENPLLLAAIARSLPANYGFEVPKTIWRATEAKATCIALQLPEGLLLYANALADIVKEFCKARVVVLADVTYGACCVDDLTAKALGADFLVHYGHSCLVPMTVTGPLKSLYVFVEIGFDVDHLVGCVEAQFGTRAITAGEAGESRAAAARLALAGTIQFASGVERARGALESRGLSSLVPQQMPLSAGEVLGCTSPKLTARVDAIVFVADGRFHLESIMIHNPDVPAFRYDPYGKGSPDVLRRVKALLVARGISHFCLVLSEITADKLAIFDAHVDAWVQVACPRLSIDWGHAFSRPLLSSYEAHVAFGAEAWVDGHYPMDYYAKNDKPWTNYFPSSKSLAGAVS